MSKTGGLLSSMTNVSKHSKNTISVVVKESSDMKKKADLAGHSVGTLANINTVGSKKILKELTNSGISMEQKEFGSMTEMLESFYNGEVDSIVISESSRSQITDIDAYKDFDNNIILSTCLGAKNEAYKHEQETRGVVHCDDASKIKYRVRNGYIAPYVEIRVPKEALKKIVVGPTNNKMLTVQSIYHFLQINGYDINKIDVVSSKIPYRG